MISVRHRIVNTVRKQTKIRNNNTVVPNIQYCFATRLNQIFDEKTYFNLSVPC